MIPDNEIAYILYSLRYQYAATGLTTIGYCPTGCGKPSRGGGTCPDCLVADLVKLGVPKSQAQAYQSTLAQIQRLRIEAEELAEKITAPPVLDGSEGAAS